MRLARQTLLPYPQDAADENQGLGTLNDLPNLMQLMGSGQKALCFFLFTTLP